MDKNLQRASELTKELEKLAKQAGRRSGDEVAVEQIATFGELLVALAEYIDRAQNTIKWLTVVLAVLTALLVIDALPRLFKLFQAVVALIHQFSSP